MSLPAVRAALIDRRLRRLDLLVYGEALSELDLQDWREWKRLIITRRTHMRPEHVSRSLRRLVSLGYVERRAEGSGARSYRLRYSPAGVPPEAPSRVA